MIRLLYRRQKIGSNYLTLIITMPNSAWDRLYHLLKSKRALNNSSRDEKVHKPSIRMPGSFLTPSQVRSKTRDDTRKARKLVSGLKRTILLADKQAKKVTESLSISARRNVSLSLDFGTLTRSLVPDFKSRIEPSLQWFKDNLTVALDITRERIHDPLWGTLLRFENIPPEIAQRFFTKRIHPRDLDKQAPEDLVPVLPQVIPKMEKAIFNPGGSLHDIRQFILSLDDFQALERFEELVVSYSEFLEPQEIASILSDDIRNIISNPNEIFIQNPLRMQEEYSQFADWSQSQGLNMSNADAYSQAYGLSS